MTIVISFILGSLFAVGLSLSGMVNPHKVIGFLDVFGSWDPALVFVMGGGVMINLILFKFILKRKNPLLGGSFQVPTNKDIDGRLILGSILFGIGWGIGGVCPGPGISNLFLFSPSILVFLAFMFIGMFIFEKFFSIK